MKRRVVVIGGNAAGMTAASRAKRLDPDLEITILERSHFISYSICGLPYYISNTVPHHDQLVSFTPESLEDERGIQARVRVQAEEVRPSRRTVVCTELESGREFELPYDLAVLSTGYIPNVPRIEGCELANVLTVSHLEHGIRIRDEIERHDCRKVVIVGAGYIGLMMAHALRTIGLEVTLIDRNKHVFGQVDEDMADHIEEELRRNGIQLVLQTDVKRLVGRDGVFAGVEIRDSGRAEQLAADLALVDVGISPNVELALRSGIACGPSGAIQVDERGQTRAAGIYAAGNCAETIHLVSERPIFSALGTTAAKQGRVVGENLAGHRSFFRGSLETSIEKVFDLALARTGLTLKEASSLGFNAGSVKITGRTRAAYYPGSQKVQVKLVFEKLGGRLLGGQIVGEDSVAKRIDTLVAALTAKMTLPEIAQLDLAYAPPYATLWDPIHVAANIGMRKLDY